MKHSLRIIFVAFLVLLGFACRSQKSQPDNTTADSSKQVQHLLRAARNENQDELLELLASGIDINSIEEGWGTALYQAVFGDDVNAVGLLLKCGADANRGNEHGHTPLHAATESESEDAIKLVRLLISYGANVNAKIKSDIVPDGWIDISEGRTPLHNAAMVSSINEDLEIVSNKAVVELLLAHGANVNAQDAFGSTALSDALFSQSLDVIELLIKHGADFNIKTMKMVAPYYMMQLMMGG
jgi:ankyrin repeat protein